MPDCELLVTCPFFSNGTYGLAEKLKEQYCKGDYAWCGRYMNFKGREAGEGKPLEGNKRRQARALSGSRKGLPCPFEAIICQEGYCQSCQVYLDRQNLGGSTVQKGDSLEDEVRRVS